MKSNKKKPPEGVGNIIPGLPDKHSLCRYIRRSHHTDYFTEGTGLKAILEVRLFYDKIAAWDSKAKLQRMLKMAYDAGEKKGRNPCGAPVARIWTPR